MKTKVESIQAKFRKARQELNAGLIERHDEIDMVLVAMVCGEHALFVGDPGSAKSMLCDALADWVGGKSFSVLLNKYSTPEEVFGPISVASLERDEYKRIVNGFMPDATVAFIDEIWKASSAILNTMLKVLNERTFVNGTQLVKCPLRVAMAASNEWPDEDEELGALFDRFLFRKTVRNIATRRGEESLLWRDDLEVVFSDHLSEPELTAAIDAAKKLPWNDAAKDAMRQILAELKDEGIIPGDRRKRKAVGASRAAAFVAGADEVKPEHLWCLQDVLWVDPKEQPQKAAEIVGKIANPEAMQVNSLLSEVEEVLSSTKPGDLASAAVASKKLDEISKKLRKLEGANGRAKIGAQYVKEELVALKRAAIAAI